MGVLFVDPATKPNLLIGISRAILFFDRIVCQIVELECFAADAV